MSMILKTKFLRGFIQNGDHLEIETNLPCRISKGGHSFRFTNSMGRVRISKPHLWYVVFDDDLLDIVVVKGFKRPEAAIEYAVLGMTKVATKLLKELDKYENFTLIKNPE